MSQPITQLKIFISYGHEIGVKDEKTGELRYPEPNNENVVRKFVEFIRQRGHDVWIDRIKIDEFTDWRGEITRGILDSDVALIFLTPKALRPKGVCLDEMNIAVGVRGGNIHPVLLEDATIPSYLTTRQMFMLADWRDHWKALEDYDVQWFEEKFEALAQKIEAQEVHQYGTEIRDLKRRLSPFDFDSRLKRLLPKEKQILDPQTNERISIQAEKFVGRESLFEEFEGRIARADEGNTLPEDRFFWLCKGAGFGKSRFAAELMNRYRRVFPAVYFTDFISQRSKDPRVFVQTLAYQLAQRYDDYRALLLTTLQEHERFETYSPQDLFEILINAPLSKSIDGNHPCGWILVDALDEAGTDTNNPFAWLIQNNLDKLPSWLGFVVTSRDEETIHRIFAGQTPVSYPDTENEEDIRCYIDNEMEAMKIADTPQTRDIKKALLDKSEGTIIYPVMVLRGVKNSLISITDILDLPTGLTQYIGSQFERYYGHQIDFYQEQVCPLLEYIFAAKEPISRGTLKYCSEIEKDRELNKILDQLGTFFNQTGKDDVDTVTPFHKSVANYCCDVAVSHDFYVSVSDGEKKFAEKGLELYDSGALYWTRRNENEPTVAEGYFLTWLPSHLMDVNRKENTAKVMSDFPYLMKRLQYGNVKRVLLDYLLFGNKLNRVTKECDAFVDVIRSNVHLLRRDSEQNPAYKIMLQVATEVADECPVTQAAERWLNPAEGESPCDWFWLNKCKRPKEYQPNPCKLVIEDTGKYVIVLSNGNTLSWGTDDHNLYIWNLETGIREATLEGHSGEIIGVLELKSGDILSWSKDNTLRLWLSDGTCKVEMKGHSNCVNRALELQSEDILSWSNDDTLRLWSPDGICKAVMKGHSDRVRGALELKFGDILSWSVDDTLRLWSPDGICKAVMTGHSGEFIRALELQSGDILSWSRDNILRLWSPVGTCKVEMKGHSDWVHEALELQSGDILSWSNDNTLRLWLPDGTCKAEMKGHSAWIHGALELKSGDILSWSNDNTLRLWSLDGTCKVEMTGHSGGVIGALELQSGDILSWSNDNTLRLWSPVGTCKVEMKGDSDRVHGALELQSGDILSWDDNTLRLWLLNGTCKAVMQGHTSTIIGTLELQHGDILSWSWDNTLRFWSPDSMCKAVLPEYMCSVKGTLELQTGDILSWSNDNTLRLWSSDGTCKVVMQGHTCSVKGTLELQTGNLLSWSDDKTLRLWSPDGTCKTEMTGHSGKIIGVLELQSEDILSWSDDKTLRLWSSTGMYKAVTKGHIGSINGVLELQSGNLLSWSLWDETLHIWSPNDMCKAKMTWHCDLVCDALELKSGDILSWSHDKILRIWSPNGMCKAKMTGHSDEVWGALELKSRDILSWSLDNTLRRWSPDGMCKAKMIGHRDAVWGALELKSGDILSWSYDKTLHIWSPDGTCKEVITLNDSKFDKYYSLFYKQDIRDSYYAKKTKHGIELQHEFKPFALWNKSYCNTRFIGPARLCVWYGNNLDFLQLNYGNHKSISFEQAHQFLEGTIQESDLVTYVPPKPKLGFWQWLFGRK